MPGSKPATSRVEAHVDAQAAHGAEQALGHVGVEGAHQLVGALDQGDLGAPADERLGHLQADVAAADHDHATGTGTCGRGRASALASSSVWTPLDVVEVDAREVGAGRAGAGGDVQLVELERDGALPGVVAHLDACGRPGRCRATSCRSRTSMRCCSRNSSGDAGDQVVERRHVAADEVRDAAGGVARPRALLEGDDLQVGLPAAGLHGGRHAAGVATDDHQPLSHGPQATRAPMRDFRAWPCARDCRHYSTRADAVGRRRAALPGRRRRRWRPFACPEDCLFFEAPLDHRRRLAALRDPSDED